MTGLSYPLWSSEIGDVPPSVINQTLGTTSPLAVALTTVGAGTITAAGFAGRVTLRSGATSAFTDTTDTPAAIIAAALPQNAAVGSSFFYTYVNNTVAAATIAGASGVTVSGVTVVPANSWVRYLVTYTATNTLTMVGVEQGYFPHTGTFVLNGVTPVTVSATSVTVASAIIINLQTVGGTVGVYPHIATITPATGFTVLGTASDTSTYQFTILG